MAALDLTDEEREALIRFLREAIERDRFPLSPRLAPIRAVLAKLQPTPPPPPSPEPPRKIEPPRMASRKRSRW